jgi:hypothetical protein
MHGYIVIVSCLQNVSVFAHPLTAQKLIDSWVAGHPNNAVDLEIGAAEAYRAAVIFSYNPGGNVVPPWLANLNANVQQIAADVNQVRADHCRLKFIWPPAADVQQIRGDIAHLRQRSDELPIMLANSQVGPRGHLFNPTAIANGWAPLLVAPNPTSRDELLSFTCKLDSTSSTWMLSISYHNCLHFIYSPAMYCLCGWFRSPIVTCTNPCSWEAKADCSKNWSFDWLSLLLGLNLRSSAITYPKHQDFYTPNFFSESMYVQVVLLFLFVSSCCSTSSSLFLSIHVVGLVHESLVYSLVY